MATEGRVRSRVADLVWALVTVLLAGLCWYWSRAPLAGDDLWFSVWSLGSTSPADALLGPEGATHWRPLTSLAWWLGPRRALDGTAVRLLQCALWVAVVVVLARAAFARRGPVAAVAVVLTLAMYQVFVDLLIWKSWLSTTGTVFGLAVGLVELQRARPRGWVVLLCGLVALGFKETGALTLGVAALGATSTGFAGIGLVLAAVGVASVAVSKLDVTMLGSNVADQLTALGHGAFVLPILLSSRWPRAPWWVPLLGGAALFLPDRVAGVAVVVVAGLVLARKPAWGAAMAVAWLVPLPGKVAARQYVLEGWTVLAAATGLVAPRAWTCALAMVLALPQLGDYARNRATLVEPWREQSAFLDTFHPAPVDVLYRPDAMAAYDLDLLVWLSLGARLDGPPPPGSRPLYVGPRSGVWAGLQTP